MSKCCVSLLARMSYDVICPMHCQIERGNHTQLKTSTSLMWKSNAINLPLGDVVSPIHFYMNLHIYIYICIYSFGWCTLGFTYPSLHRFSAEACTLVVRHITANLGHSLGAHLLESGFLNGFVEGKIYRKP